MNVEPEKYTIGTIEFTDSIAESYTKMNFDSIGICEINIYGKEGIIPHFHILSKSRSKVKGNKSNFNCCICLYEPLYFNHGTKQDKLDKKSKEKLNSWLSEPVDQNTSTTNWEMLCYIWKFAGNPMINVPNNPKQPDYTKLEYMKG